MISRKNSLSLPKDWFDILHEECQKDYFVSLKNKIIKEQKVIRPNLNKIFFAFELCKFENLKVVILGQDPYHNVGQAHGLAFSVPEGIEKPPSLVNILKELKRDLDVEFAHGCLESWARQGVLMLNSFLTVELHKPLSHSKIGWEIFTDEVIRKISDLKNSVVFVLWGGFARSKRSLIDSKKHLILESAHPSPLSAAKFFGCSHFSKVNNYLSSKSISPVDWS